MMKLEKVHVSNANLSLAHYALAVMDIKRAMSQHELQASLFVYSSEYGSLIRKLMDASIPTSEDLPIKNSFYGLAWRDLRQVAALSSKPWFSISHNPFEEARTDPANVGLVAYERNMVCHDSTALGYWKPIEGSNVSTAAKALIMFNGQEQL